MTKKVNTGGRNKLPKGEKKEEVRLFVKGSEIKLAGGEKELKKQLYRFIALKTNSVTLPSQTST